MKNLFKVLAIFSLILSVTTFSYAGDSYKIGVLAKRGPVKALKQWKATGGYLTANIPGKTFEIVPLDFDAVNPAIEKGDVDFFLVNSSMFVTAQVKYGASSIATIVNSRQGQPLKSFGGVILTSVENEDINSMTDLKGKSFMAVKASSFGGWQMAYKEIIDAGINPKKDFASLQFGGKHDNVVLAVQNGAVDAGTVRTDTLKRMVAGGNIDMEEFKIINKKEHNDFPFVCSSVLYPEWPMGKVQKTPDDVAKVVADALKQMKPENPAARNAKIVGWIDAADYTPVEDLQKILKVGAYSN